MMSELKHLLDHAFDVQLSESAETRIMDELDEELRQAFEPKPIMTLAEVSDYLRVSPELVYELMGNIPCFELGGRVLFRKQAVDAWIIKREEQFAGEIAEFEVNRGLKLCL